MKLATADAIVAEMAGAILAELAPKRGAEALLFVNGFGGTPAMELYLVYHAAAKLAAGRGVRIVRSLVVNYVTSLDMAGCSLTFRSDERRVGNVCVSTCISRCLPHLSNKTYSSLIQLLSYYFTS